MRILTKLIVAFTLFPTFLFAQGTFKPGYLVNMQGDTLKGFIKLSQSDNINKFIFKKNNAADQTYTVKDVKYFNIDNIISYLRYEGPITTAHTDIYKITYRRDTSVVNAEVFLKVEQEGQSVNLYSYSDDIKTRYFLKERETSQPVELIYRAYLTSAVNVSVKSENTYKLQLLNLANKYANNDEKLAVLIDQSNYNLNDLEPIFKKLNNNNVVKSKKSHYVSFFAGAGISFNDFDVSRADLPFYGATSQSSVFPKIQAGLEFHPNPIISKFVIRAEVSATKNKYKTDIDVYTDGRPESKSSYAFEQLQVSTQILFLYNVYYTDPLKFYVGAGVNYNLASYNDNTYINNYTRVTSSIALFNQWLAFPVRIGAIINKKIDASVSYNPPVVVGSGGIKQSNLQFGVNYFFN